MPDHYPFSEARQRRALRALAETPEFLESTEGLEFIKELKVSFAPSLLASGRRLGIGAQWCEADDIVHTALVGLLSNEARVARYAAAASTEPWPYVARCLRTWMRGQWGFRAMMLDDELQRSPVGDGSTEQLTPLETVVQVTFRLLAPHTHTAQHDDLLSVLQWCAENPPQRRSYEGRDRAAAGQSFPTFSDAQIVAISRVCWGVRPNAAKSSLMGAVLRDTNFRPSDSPSHTGAVLQYRRVMLAAHVPEASARLAA